MGHWSLKYHSNHQSALHTWQLYGILIPNCGYIWSDTDFDDVRTSKMSHNSSVPQMSHFAKFENSQDSSIFSEDTRNNVLFRFSWWSTADSAHFWCDKEFHLKPSPIPTIYVKMRSELFHLKNCPLKVVPFSSWWVLLDISTLLNGVFWRFIR